MSTRSSTRNLFPPLDNPELTIRRRSRADPTLLNDFEMAAKGNGDLPVPDLRTMEELCQPSLNGRGDDANKHLDKFLHVTQSIKVNGVTDDALRLYLFPHSLTHHATAWFDRLPRNSINTFEQMVKMFLAWERYKLLIDRCLNHNMLLVTQIDTFYNGLTLRHRDTINVAARGTFMKRRPKECYDLIENMTAHHNDWDTSAQRSESSSSITSSSDTKIAALKAEMVKIKKNLMRVLQVNQQVKAITPNCETCGGPHSFNDCPATVGQTQNVDVFPTSPYYHKDHLIHYGARGSTVPNPLPDNPYMLVRQAYSLTATDIEFDLFGDPLESEEPQPLSPTPAHPSPDYTPATPHTDEELEPSETLETRVTSSPPTTPPTVLTTLPSSQQPPLTQTSSTPIPLQLFFYHSTARMAMCTQPTLSPSLSDRLIEAVALSPSSFKISGPFRALADTETRSYELKDEAEDELLGLGYEAARRHALELAEGTVPSTYKVGQRSRSTPDQRLEMTGKTYTQTHTRLPFRTTWEDPEDEPVSDTPVVPSPVASLVPAATVNEDVFLEIEAQLELHRSILPDYTKRLDALPPTLFERYGQDFTELFARYEDQKEVHELRMQCATDQRELQELRDRVIALERRMDHIEE
uniref:Reverse transcriptase domain-containing protein n=1 Tax=Tanacetum cinerariifolium TaxID=118510 RepID=A0A6L2LMX0_TANCI|nr:hypothetical protein [Tanacetum cinerariifolium]